MTLPTTSGAISAGTPADHVAWHNELDTLFPWLGLPTVTISTTSGHLAAHEALHAHIGGPTGTLPLDVNEGDPGHPSVHLPIHLWATAYGAEPTVGEALEPATTTGTQATTATISSVLAAASPGATILLRAGTYGAITIPAGTAGNPITVKPYNAEAVTITSTGFQTVQFSSYTRLAGVKVQSPGAQRLSWIGSGTATVIQDVEIRNCTLRGGTDDAINASGNVQNIRLRNCDIDGGLAHHCVLYNAISGIYFPTGSVINCLLRKRTIAQGGIFDYVSSEDLLQMDGANNVVVDRVTFGDVPSGAENGLDIKTMLGTSPQATVTRSWLKGPFLGTAEGFHVCAAVTSKTDPDKVVLVDSRISDGNYETGDETATGAASTLQRVTVDSGAALALRLSGDAPRTQGIQLLGVQMTDGLLDLGTTTAGNQPHNLNISGCSFTGTHINLNTGTTYTCTNSTFTNCTGATLTCS